MAGWIFEPEARDAPVRMRFGVHLAVVLLLAMLVSLGSGSLLWLALGQPRLSPPTPGPLKPSDLYNGIKLALAVVAGIGGVVALVVAYRRQRFAEREHHRAEAAVVREDTKLFTERFDKASQQLGSDKAAVRLAGVYALASLADDWPTGRQMCIDVLCAYMRMPYTPPVDQTAVRPGSAAANGQAADDAVNVDEREQQDRLQERQVRWTVVRVITAHLQEGAPVPWQGYDFDFSGAVFDGGSFSHAVFARGRVDFSNANFTSGDVTFIGAKFTSGRVDFSNAEFTDGRVTFNRAQFTGGWVDFINAKFTSGDVTFIGAKFIDGGVDFSNAEFTGGRVTFNRAQFTGGWVDFINAKFTSGRVDFNRAQFTDGGLDFSGAQFTGGDVTFNHAQFTDGEVDLHAAYFGVPPTFDPWTDGPPEGLLLPLLPSGDAGASGDPAPE